MEIVSVLVPLYNNKAYIVQALDSLLQERPERIELLVLDDGSSDGSSETAIGWIDGNRGKFFAARLWSRENKGIPVTLNELVRNASGEYLTILPADDELLPGGIDARIAMLRKNPGMLCVFGDAVVVDAAGSEVSGSALFTYPKKHVSPRVWALNDPDKIALEMIIRWAVPGPVFLARKEAYSPELGIGPYDESLAAEDRDFYLRCLSRKALGFIERKVARYRVHGSNVSTNLDSTARIKTSVVDSECKNLPLFSGIDRAALHVVYRYKKAVGGAESSEKALRRVICGIQALLARIAMRAFDLVQLGRRLLT